MEIRRTRVEHGTRIALSLGESGEDGEVSGLRVHHLEMRIGDVPVRTGGVGGVNTEARHRGKGYARKVMEDSNAFMAEAGFDVAVLFGIRDFYPKFGYAVCMAECGVSLSTRYAERAASRFAFSPAAESDLEAVRLLYESANSSRTGSVVRREGAWKGFNRGSRHGVKATCFAAKDSTGGLEAYVLLDDDAERTTCAEIAARSLEGYESALRFLADDAVGKRAGEIRVICPYDHVFVACSSRFGAKVELARPRCGGAMGRLIGQRSLFEKLLPLFSARLRASELRGEKLAVSITTELGRTTVGFDGEEAGLDESGRAWSSEIPARGLMQIAMGYCDPAAAGAKPDGEAALRALEALFPRQEAHTWEPDRF